MKKIEKTLFAFILLSLLYSVSVCADSISEALENSSKRAAYFEVYGQNEKAPTTTMSAGSEKVLTAEGNLSMSATDLTLPGKNGFDVAFTRNYNSNEIYDEEGDILIYSISAQMVLGDFNNSPKKVYQYYTEGDELQTPVFIAYENEEELLNLENNGKLYLASSYTQKAVTDWGGVNAQDINYTYFNTGTADFVFEAPFYHANALITGNDVTLVRDLEKTPDEIELSTYNSYIYKSYTLEEKQPIGNGWSFDLFTAKGTKLEIQGSMLEEYGEFRDPENGMLLEYYINYRDLMYVNPDATQSNFWFNVGSVRRFVTTGTGVKESSMYTIKAVKGVYDADPTDPEDYTIEIQRYDGVTYYLRDQGWKKKILVKKTDRFGNKVLYTGTKGTDGLIDSYGRTIAYEKTDGKISGILVDGVRAVDYELTDTNNASIDPYNVLSSDNIHSLKVTKGGNDVDNNTIVYSGRYRQNAWVTSSVLDDNGTVSTLNGITFNLEEILLPTGGKICYVYENRREAIPTQTALKRDRQRIVERKEYLADSSEEINKYVYSYDQTQPDNRIATTVKSGTEHIYREYYTKKGQLKKTEEESENGFQRKEFTYTEQKEGNELLTQMVVYQYDENQENEKSITTVYEYGSFQQLVSETDGMQEKLWYYDYHYGILKRHTIRQSDNMVVGTANTISSEGKFITQTRNISIRGEANSVTYETTQYSYYANGEIKKSFKKARPQQKIGPLRLLMNIFPLMILIRKKIF